MVPLSVIPPPVAVASVGDATLPSSIFVSLTAKFVVLIVVVVPLTVRSPVNVSEVAYKDPLVAYTNAFAFVIGFADKSGAPTRYIFAAVVNAPAVFFVS